QVVQFDPLRDTALPPRCAAVILPGGFPECHADRLAANTELCAAMRAFAGAGGVVQAECAGMLYLLERLEGARMCGIVAGSAAMGGSLALGYRDAVAATDSIAYACGERVTGHEFHRTRLWLPADQRVEPDTGGRSWAPAWHWRAAGSSVTDGFADDRIHASYLHVHPAGAPASVARLLRGARSVSVT
ncbi:MAG: cobyrinate a,c-diamide synthase, partial [Sciscionella sp.]